MKTKFVVLVGLTIAAAAIVAALNTDIGKKLKNKIADNLDDWRENLNKPTDGLDKKLKNAGRA